jgi:hypothetical protein
VTRCQTAWCGPRPATMAYAAFDMCAHARRAIVTTHRVINPMHRISLALF